METSALLPWLRDEYGLEADGLSPLREGGSRTWTFFAEGGRWLLKAVPPAMARTAALAADVSRHLRLGGIRTPPIRPARGGALSVPLGDRLCFVFAFLEGTEPESGQDPEELGELVARFHLRMRAFPGALPKVSRGFYIDRYVRLLRERGYREAEAFAEIGEGLWTAVEGLPRGNGHGDLYPGNLLKTPSGYALLDLDTVCFGIPLHDVMCLCNRTDYFAFREDGYERTAETLRRFLSGYAPLIPVSPEEEKGVFDLVGVYHFQLQATILEIHGPGCVDDAFFDAQLDWLRRWRLQCEQNATRWG